MVCNSTMSHEYVTPVHCFSNNAIGYHIFIMSVNKYKCKLSYVNRCIVFAFPIVSIYNYVHRFSPMPINKYTYIRRSLLYI